MITAVAAIVFWCFCLPVLYLLGEPIGFRLSRRGKILDGIFFVALGWACLAYVLAVLGALKCLSVLPVMVFMAGILIVRGKKMTGFIQWLKAVLSFFDLRSDVWSWGWFLRTCFLFSMALTFVFCLLPESSNDGLAYHLTLPKLFIKQASIAPVEYELYSYRSFLQNLLYVIGLFFNNVPIARLFHWITGVLLVLAVARVTEQKTNSRNLGFFAGALLWLTPTLINQITTTYVDVAVTFFVFLSAFPLIEEAEKGKADIFYSGLFMGIAIAIKFLAVTAFACSFLWLAWEATRVREWKKGAGLLVLWGGGVFMGCGFWFVRNWINTGNPVYPYLTAWFNKDASFALASDYYNRMGLPRTGMNFILMFWNLTFRPVYFDYHHWIGPVYLGLFPLAVYGGWKEKKNRPYLYFIFSMTLAWFFSAQISRYLMPMFPFYLIATSLGVLWVERAFHGRIWPLIMRSVNFVLTVFLFALSLYHFRIQFLPVLGIWSTEQYLEYTERTMAISKWVNQNLPPDSKILVRGEMRLFYFDRTFVRERDFSRITRYMEHKTPAEIAASLKRMGFTHLLDGMTLQAGALPEESKFNLLTRDPSLTRELVRMVSKNGREPKFTYEVYELL